MTSTHEKQMVLQPAAAPASYALLEFNPGEIRDIIRDNIGAGGFQVSDLPRIKVPTGGATQWEVPTLDGEPEYQKAIEGVIVLHRDTRAYWLKQESTDGSPPDCSSPDGFEGQGNPGGDCTRCPLAQFGSGRDGRQACKAMRQLFIIRPSDILPVVLNVPPGSLKTFRRYLTALISSRTSVYSVVTRLTLHREKSGAGQEFAQIDAAVAAHLLPEDAARFRALGEQLRPMLFRDVAGGDFAEAGTDA